jgi:sterol desaturase/sphingolipid hydroxylase (fatty acid hydroxylase superfamily)
MDIVISTIALFLAPLTHPGTPTQRIYWLYLLSGLLIAGFLYVRRRTQSRNSLPLNLFLFLLPKEVFTHRSAILDYQFFFVSIIFLTALISPFVLGVKPVSDFVYQIMINSYDGKPVITTRSYMCDLLYTLVLVIVMDAAFFSVHFLLHKIPVLWEFHKVHHSAEVLTPITIYRIHPIEAVFTGALAAFVMGSADALVRTFICNLFEPILVLGVNIFLFMFYLFAFNLRHSHVWFSYPVSLSRIFISPAQHQIHHSKNPKHYDKNFGYILAIWDGLLNSLYIPKAKENLEFGLAQDEHLEFRSVWQLYARPFKAIWVRHIFRSNIDKV